MNDEALVRDLLAAYYRGHRISKQVGWPSTEAFLLAAAYLAPNDLSVRAALEEHVQHDTKLGGWLDRRDVYRIVEGCVKEGNSIRNAVEIVAPDPHQDAWRRRHERFRKSWRELNRVIRRRLR